MDKNLMLVSRKVKSEFHLFLAKNYQKKHGGTIANALSVTVEEFEEACSSDSVSENPSLKVLERARLYQKENGGTITEALRVTARLRR